jgi:hypothetical protein
MEWDTERRSAIRRDMAGVDQSAYRMRCEGGLSGGECGGSGHPGECGDKMATVHAWNMRWGGVARESIPK